MEQIRLEGDSPLRAVRTIDPKVNRSFPVELPSAANFVDRHDWGLTPLGARSQWSPLLQTMVSVVLSAAQPMHLIWGPDHTLIYNDGFARILGLKHPIAMGSSFKEVTPDIWEDRLLPMIRDAYQGNALHMTDIELILTRNGYPEEAHFSFSYTPMRESDGQVAGLLVTINETTDAMLENRRLYALEGITRALRSIEEPRRVLSRASRLMCEALNAGGVAFADYDPADGLVRITDGSSIPGSAPLPPAIDLNLLPACVLRRLQCGFACGAVDPQSGTGKILDISKSRSLLIAPIRSEGELVGIAVAADSQSRNWLPSEADLFFECVDRAWLLLKGALATKNKDEAEAHLRQILAVSPHLNWQASATNEAIFMDERWADYTGLPLKDLSGSWTEFTHPADAAALWSAWTLALKTNTPFEKEIRLRRHDGVYKWFLVRGVPFDDSKHGRSWVGTCTDIDSRMRAEQSSRDLVIEMDHRVKNILAVVQSLAHQSFTEGDPGQIKRTLKSRIAALAHAHGTPSMDEWQTQSLQATLASLLDGFDLPSQNWSIEGDDIPLPVESVSTLALAIHELASETARYGGERSSTAKIDIVVRNDPFRFDWKETCPLGIIPWPDNSFRTRLLGAAFKRLFDAEVQMEVAPNAVTFSAGKS